jgi:hypothetical protein
MNYAWNTRRVDALTTGVLLTILAAEIYFLMIK